MSDFNVLNDLQNDNILNILKSDKDLKEYSKNIESELKSVENQAIDDYIKESGNIAALHSRISDADVVLDRMENLLDEFQNLSNISSEIIGLKRRSVQITQQLTNRQEVLLRLNEFIEDILISNDLIDTILLEYVADAKFLDQLHVLNDKLNFAKEQNFNETRASKEIHDVLEKLRIKSVSKIRHYLLEQIYKFRKPLSNYQIPQNVLLKSKFLFEFLLSHERRVAQEICNEYIDTMSKIYFSYFKSYCGRLDKLRFDDSPAKDDLMGLDDSSSNRGLFYKSSLKNKGTVFTIGNRDEVLVQQLEAPIIVPHVQNKNQYQFEVLFRSQHYALVDNACREYLYICEFFMVQGTQAQNLFNQIMEKTLSLLIRNLQSFVQETFDILALFLSVHLVLRYQIMCHKRCVPALDRYWDKLQAIIWPRFEFLFKLNIQSIRECDTKKFSKEVGPHFITRRYAEFSAAIVGISENFPNDLVNRLLAELQEEVDMFILRMASLFKSKKGFLVFLINNYDMILNVLMEHTKDTSKEAEYFRKRLTSRSNEFVQEILLKHFESLMKFVNESESDLREGKSSNETNAENVVKDFCHTWQKSLEKINREVLISFPNLVTGSTLFQLSVTVLLDYHQRLNSLLPANLKTQLTNIHHIRVELKKYRTCY